MGRLLIHGDQGVIFLLANEHLTQMQTGEKEDVSSQVSNVLTDVCTHT